MTREEVDRWVAELMSGRISPTQLADLLTGAKPPSAELGEVTFDLDRQRRCGYPEVVFGEGKSVETLERIYRRMISERIDGLTTRVSQEKADVLLAEFPQARYNAVARTLRLPIAESDASAVELVGYVAVVTAGTSDLPVAEEARETLDWMGVRTAMVHDVGVAGPHRLPAQLDKLRSADAVVVAAGMEGALPSVVGGYVDCPVIAVPTSVGYGASFHGLAALLGMLNSCAANVVVVNIDAGFKGGYVAGMIARRRGRPA